MRDDKLEDSLIGAIILHPEWADDVDGVCTADDFYGRGSALMWAAVVSSAERDESRLQTLDVADLDRRLRENGGHKLLGGMDCLTRFTDEGYRVLTRERAVKYATQVRRMAQVRRFAEAAAEVAEDGRALIDDPIGYLERAESRLTPLMRGESEGPKLLYGRMTKIMQSMALGRQRGIKSGFAELDRFTLGLRRGGLIVIGARPGHGKSALAMGIADRVATDGAHVLVFSLEMPEAEQVARLVSIESRVPLTSVMRGKYDSNRDAGFANAAAIRIEKLPIAIDDDEEVTIQQIRARSRAFHREHCRTPIGDEPTDLVIIVDYLQLITILESSGSRDQDIGTLSRGLKKLARELNCPVIALSQLNRKVDDRNPPRPHMGDLRESGNIEQDADLILLVWRPEKYDRNTRRPGMAEVIIGKQRNGPTGAFWLDYVGEIVRFDDAKNPDPPPDAKPPDKSSKTRTTKPKTSSPPEHVPPPEDD